MKILITGIAGFVGSTLARKMLEMNKSIEVVGIDNLSYGSVSRILDIKEKIDFHQADVKDLPSNKDISAVDVIIHCAAIAPLPDNQVAPYSSIEQNVAMCAAVSDFATKIGCKNIIFFSSGAIYEGSGNRPCKECDDINTSLMYPTSKYLAEQLFSVMAKTYGIKVIAIRLFNLYGPNQDYFRKQPPLLGYLLKSYLKKEAITLFASEHAKRDYIYIDDLYELIQCIINKFKDIPDGCFVKVNAGSENTYSVYDIVSILSDLVGENIEFEKGDKENFWDKYPEIFDRKVPFNKQYLIDEVDKVAISDISFAKEYFGWEPRFKMKEGLLECLEFARGVVK
ncbi:NAD-dependent epimerase/dehydratase family protein [Marinomonas polaris]|uniref:NAD-dependent epimerase/dehydratase family protein n=1 Tax=Marinomonas polaris TaxID=293552 RepID=UPI003F9B6B3B